MTARPTGKSEQRKPANVEHESGVVVARESRRHPRRKVLLPARISTLQGVVDADNDDPYFVLTEARTFDLGDAGAGLEVDDPMPEGKRVVVELDLPDGDLLLRLARVMWLARDSKSYYLGLRFEEPVPGLSARV